MAPLVSPNTRTKKEKTTKQNVISEAQLELPPPKTLKRKKEVDQLVIQEYKKSLKRSKNDESRPLKSAKVSRSASGEREDVAKVKSSKNRSKILSTTPPISSTKPSKEKKPALSEPELRITSISRLGRVSVVAEKSKGPSPEPESPSAEEEEEYEDNGGHLHGLSTDDEDSSDEDVMDDEPSAFDVSKLPTIAKDDATVKQKLDKAKRQPAEDRGILFIGRLPHGFYEDQLKAYFSQFGNVTRLRVSRNKKTGKSKHYGFIEFDSSSVARIVADTMDNYLIMGHILRCKFIPKDQVHPELWVGANRKWRIVPRDRLTRVEHNKPRTQSEQMKAAKRLLKRQNERERKLAQAGIKYDFEAVSYKKANLVES